MSWLLAKKTTGGLSSESTIRDPGGGIGSTGCARSDFFAPLRMPLATSQSLSSLTFDAGDGDCDEANGGASGTADDTAMLGKSDENS
jgi:hypothetical protein